MEFMLENRDLIYNTLLTKYIENETGDVFIDLDVKTIEGRDYVSSVRYSYTERLDGYQNLLNYFHVNEEYDKCLIIKNLTEKYKENSLESV